MLNRRNRNLRAPGIIQGMKELDECQELMGKYKKIGVNKHVFYKVPPDQVSVAKLDSYAVSEAEYTKNFEWDMSTNPCPRLPYQWPQYYEEIMQKAPDMVQQEQHI